VGRANYRALGGTYGYRNRAQWAVRSGMPRAIGYFPAESSVIIRSMNARCFPAADACVFATSGDGTSGYAPGGIQEIEAFTDSADERLR